LLKRFFHAGIMPKCQPGGKDDFEDASETNPADVNLSLHPSDKGLSLGTPPIFVALNPYLNEPSQRGPRDDQNSGGISMYQVTAPRTGYKGPFCGERCSDPSSFLRLRRGTRGNGNRDGRSSLLFRGSSVYRYSFGADGVNR
jgi:hypothetical protein